MKLIPFLIVCLFFSYVGISKAQFAPITLPNEILLEQINQNKFNGISFQAIKRKDWSKRYYKSTAFFISKNCLLTSAHNLKTIKSHRVAKVSIYPSRKGSNKPYGTVSFKVENDNYYKKVNRSFFKFRWRKRPHDLALIYVPDSIIAKNEKLQELDYLPLLKNDEDFHKGDTVYSVGYPATDAYSGHIVMTMVNSTIKRIHKYHFSHDLETYRGNSGSPIMVKRNNRFYVVGVNSIHYYGTWLNKKRQRLIKAWISELEKINN